MEQSQDWRRIELATDGGIDANPQAGPQPTTSREMKCNLAVRRCALLWRQRGSTATQFLSQGRTRGERHAFAQIEHSPG
jgi:hypothetical protein